MGLMFIAYQSNDSENSEFSDYSEDRALTFIPRAAA